MLNRHSAKVFLLVSIALALFTNMNKVLVPALVFDSLQTDLGLSAVALAGLGSCYMFSMAISQFVMGLFTDRIGGIRVVLMGGLAFCVGMLMFPLTSNLWVMQAARIISAFGGGITFLGISKIIADTYPEKFTSMLSVYLVVAYTGPIVGTALIPMISHACGWRIAMMVPTIISIVLFVISLFFLPKKKSGAESAAGGNMLQPLRSVLSNRNILKIFLSSSIVYGNYYALQTLMGAKCLTDLGLFSSQGSYFYMTFLGVVVVCVTMSSGLICRLMRGRYRQGMRLAAGLNLAGAALGVIGLLLPGGRWLLPVGYLLLALPAGGFSIFGTMCKDGARPDCVALVIALLNFAAFVMISVMGALAGAVMHYYEKGATMVGGRLVYSVTAYQSVFLLFLVAGVFSMLATVGLFRDRNIGR